MNERLPMNEGEIFMPTQERVMVFAAGEGSIEPTGQYSDDEVMAASDEAQKPIEDSAVVCMDERGSAEGDQPVREKVAGGNLATGTFAAVAVDWLLLTEEVKGRGPQAVIDVVATHLVDTGERLGGHTSNHASGDTTDCGAVDKSGQTTDNIDKYATDEAWIDQAKIDLGDGFRQDHWDKSHAGFSALARNTKWKNWQRSYIQEAIKKHGGIVEVVDATPDIDRDPQNVRHNHWGEAARINHQAGKSNDRDHASIPTFQVDVDALVRTARKMASSEDEFSLLLHAMVMFQYGTTYTLTRNMRIIR